MTQEKHTSLTKYLENQKIRLSNLKSAKDVPGLAEKRAWLERDIQRTQNRLDSESIVIPKTK